MTKSLAVTKRGRQALQTQRTLVVLQLDRLAGEAQLRDADARHRAQRRIDQQLRAQRGLRSRHTAISAGAVIMPARAALCVRTEVLNVLSNGQQCHLRANHVIQSCSTIIECDPALFA